MKPAATETEKLGKRRAYYWTLSPQERKALNDRCNARKKERERLKFSTPELEKAWR